MIDRSVTPRRVALVTLVVATVLAVAWTLWPDRSTPNSLTAPGPQSIEPGTHLKPAVCNRAATKPFRPRTITVRKVAHNAEVLGLGRDANNVPQAPPISSIGKTQFAWDDANTSRDHGRAPGTKHGNVLINAHTWPDGTALGNRLLEHLHVGGRIIVRGTHAELCYRVTKRIVVRAADGAPEYYENDGPPQLALIVCSPPRLGPGNWENRTIWFASPMNVT